MHLIKLPDLFRFVDNFVTKICDAILFSGDRILKNNVIPCYTNQCGM